MPTLREIMSPTVIALSPEMSVADAAIRLEKYRVSGAPVVDGGRVVGVVSNTDLRNTIAEAADPARGFTPEERRELQQAEERMLAAAARHAAHAKTNGSLGQPWPTPAPNRTAPLRRSVSDVMSRRIVMLPPDADVEQAALLMRREGVHRVLVMEGEVLLGVVSTLDLANVERSASGTSSEKPS